MIDPNNPEVLYFGGNQLNRSTDRGETWSLISPAEQNDLTGTFAPGRNDPIYCRWGTITTIAVSKTDPQTIYVGTDTGRLWKTEDLGTTWTEFTDKGLPERWVTRVAIDPDDEDVVYATFSGFRNGEDAAHVFRTTDGGESWATSAATCRTRRSTTSWSTAARHHVRRHRRRGLHAHERQAELEAAGDGLPLVPVLDLRLHEPSDTLYAGTFGRSVWKVGV